MHAHALRFGARELGATFPKIEEKIAINQAAQAEALALAVRIQRDAAVPMILAQPALSAMAQAIAASFSAGEKFVEAHRSFASLRDELRIKASGSPDGCPDPRRFFVGGELAGAAAA